MTKNLAGATRPGNVPRWSWFWRTCADCGRSSESVKYVLHQERNLCWPRCPGQQEGEQ